MGKYIKNALAYVRGLFWGIVSIPYNHRKIAFILRLFISATIDFDSGAMITIGKGAKIRERAVVSVRKNGILKIDKNASIGMDCKIAVHEKVEIGEGTLLSPNVMVFDHDHAFNSVVGVRRKEFKSCPVIIGKNCWIGANTVILRGTTIGDNCIVGAGSVLRGEYPNNTVIVQKRETTILSSGNYVLNCENNDG